jgi:voltage-gated potassium channel
MGGLIRSRINRLFTILGGLVVTHTLILWAAEPLSFFEAVWLTMTTLVTVGYGDYSPVTPVGRISTILLMFISAITLLTLIVAVPLATWIAWPHRGCGSATCSSPRRFAPPAGPPS